MCKKKNHNTGKSVGKSIDLTHILSIPSHIMYGGNDHLSSSLNINIAGGEPCQKPTKFTLISDKNGYRPNN